MGLIQNLRSRLRLPTRAELELGYLNESSSAIDLEMRQREIDRGRFRNTSRRG